MTITTLLSAAVLSLLGYYETRRLGAQLDSAEIVETAPVTGSLIVGVACTASILVTDVEPAVALEQSVRLTAGSIIWLLGVQGALADQGHITPSWELLPSPLDAHARDSINITEVDG